MSICCRTDLAAINATGWHGPVIDARRETIEAGIAALEGHTREAIGLYGEALGSWRGLKVTWEEALTGLDMVRVLDTSIPEVKAVAVSTGQIFERLGAAPYLAMLNDALGASGIPPMPTGIEPVEATTAVEAG